MTKLDIISKVSQEVSLPKNKAEEAVEAIIDEIKQCLKKNESIILRRFGTFQIKNKSKRIGRNPKTGKEADISPRKVVRFKAGKYFKDDVNNGKDDETNVV